MRALAAFIAPHKGILLGGMVLGIGTAATFLAVPLVTRDVLAELGGSGNPTSATTIKLFALMLFGAGLGMGQGILLGMLGERIVLDTRVGIVQRLLRVRTTVLATRPAGELVARVTSDTTLLREATTSSLVQLVRASITLVGSLVLMFRLDPVLMAACVGALTAMSVGVSIVIPRLATSARQAQEALGRLGGALDGALRAIRTVKSSVAEGRESDRILVHAHEAASEGGRAVRTAALVGVISSAGNQLTILITLGLGAVRVSNETLTIPTLIAFLLYAFQLGEPISTLTNTVGQLQAGVAAAARVRDLQDLEVEQDSRQVVPHHSPPAVLEFHDVDAGYPDGEPVLHGIALAIPRKGHIAIVGPSGAGKSTLFSLMLRFIDPLRGEVFLDGVSLRDWSLARLRRRIVYLEQDAPLLPGTLRENLAYVRPEATDEEIWAALRAVRLDDRVRAMPAGLDSEPSAATVSGGERQRIALARALVARPEILLLDEATAQLDGITESVVQQFIADIGRTGAVVSIAHRLSTVMDADQIIVLEDGRIRAAGDHRQLLAADELYQGLVAALRIGAPHSGSAKLSEPAGENPVGILRQEVPGASPINFESPM
ncbi:ABC transporter ATP-binding protein [Streptomyces sp. NBC_00878]|uniref:ABC transporter ATP-binding protein n=1 Tax=Streptomyces sp. NBC_00878 TaxID=2975854 RepID=UPI00224CEF5F|nr:ABC transporter ATP-binding protein [Streptomyces sp. NBC_00878]MCX4909698.1 ABC transporter ATP-binding protein/permease [Streptomyces sp. NBC_00878]